MSMNELVYCHLCILKDRCEFSASEESYKFYHWDGCGNYPLSQNEDEKLNLAILNCPIRKLVESKDVKPNE